MLGLRCKNGLGDEGWRWEVTKISKEVTNWTLQGDDLRCHPQASLVESRHPGQACAG